MRVIQFVCTHRRSYQTTYFDKEQSIAETYFARNDSFFNFQTIKARKRLFHWISMKSRLVRAARETSKFQNWSLFTNTCRRYMAEILPRRRKTLSNQSINQTINFILHSRYTSSKVSFRTDICTCSYYFQNLDKHSCLTRQNRFDLQWC